MSHEKILIVEDEETSAPGSPNWVPSWGYRTETAAPRSTRLEKATVESCHRDHRPQDAAHGGHRTAAKAGGADPGDGGDPGEESRRYIDSAVQAMRLGAYDYITKPIDTQRLRAMLQNASALLVLRAELESTRRRLRDSALSVNCAARRRKMQEIFRAVELVSPSTASVLITGSSGTGKELVARTIHQLSPRRERPCVTMDCTAVPIESEIFGHEKGAFTGALERRTGCFELAEGGTILLDEMAMWVGTRQNCCAFSKITSCAAWAARSRLQSMCACSPPR